MAIDDKRQGGPTITTCPYAAQVRGPALVGRCGHRRQDLNPRSEPDGSLPDLPALELEDALHRVLVETEQPSHRPVAKGWAFLDHGLDGFGKAFLHPWSCLFDRLVIHRASRHLEPTAQFGNRDVIPIFLQSLADRLDHFSSSSSRDCNFFRALSSNIPSPHASSRSLSCPSHYSRTTCGLA